ncbi:MAG TPA: phosphoglycerate kinase [Bacilli bacterium]|nr:phosphoglycerate kinase [Bacilli bacterium]
MKVNVKDINVKGKTVIVRSDLNVPLKNGKIIDDSRIIASVETIKYVLDNGGKAIILSHLGKVKTYSDAKSNSLKPVAERLDELLNGKVHFVNATTGLAVENAIKSLPYGEALLLENTRFEDIDGSKESKNNQELAKYWASLGELFINDAFGTLHREHASNVGISSFLSSAIGFLVEKELHELDKLDNPERPFMVIMGGSKVSDKLKVIENLVVKADKILIGGGMAFTFLKAKGIEIGKSIVEYDQIEFCKNILDNYNDKIILPIDFKVGNEFVDSPALMTDQIKKYQMGLDIGPKTVEFFKKELADAKTLFWNGPLGVYEFKNYQEGTIKILEFVANSRTYSIIGGGDIVTCANQFGFADKLSFLSTGGGAALEYIGSKDLPGLKNIREK